MGREKELDLMIPWVGCGIGIDNRVCILCVILGGAGR